jgi:hypothetical protein
MPRPLKRRSGSGAVRNYRGANNMDDGPAKYMLFVGLAFAVFIFFWIYNIQTSSTKTTS